MMKRTLAWLLCAAMLLSVMPNISLQAEAVGPGASSVCDHIGHDGATWTAWNTADAMPDGNVAGYYYLNTDVSISTGWDVYADIHLCLNGHSLTQTGANQRVINVRGGGELSIYDCTGKATAKLTGGTGTSGAAVNVNRLGKLNLYGGIITGNGNGASGGAVYLSAANDSVKTGGMFCMYGGTITGNKCLNGNVYVAGGKEGYTNTAFHMYGGTITGNEATGNGGAILAKAYGIVNITGGIITGNTTAAGAAVSVTDNARLTVSGDVVIAENTNAAKTADVVLADKLYVNQLTGGSNITIQTTADQTDAARVIAVDGQQTAIWQAGWVTYMKLDGTEQDIGYITAGAGKAFAFGHYHGDQKYTAYDGGANHNLMKTGAGYYYLTADILRNTNSSGHLSLDKNATQHLCLNGHSYTHRNPAIRLYMLDAGDKLFIEDCTSYRNEKGEFVAGGIFYAGASKSTVADGSAIQVTKGAQLTLENIKISGFTATKSAALRVLGEAANRGVLNMTNVELSGNSNDGTASVLYANTGTTVHMTDCVIRGNSATAVSAINTGGDAQVTITDCLITGNQADSYGAVNVANPNTVLKLQGKTRITGNTGGNLHIQKGEAYDADVDGLTAGASVGVTLHKDRLAEKQMHFSTVVAAGKNPLPYCFSDDDTYEVVLDGKGRLALSEKKDTPEPTDKHTHCVEGDSACTDHTLEDYVAWNDATKLPEVTGKYYLTTDVTVTNRARLESTNVTLCLNGHTIRAAEDYVKSRAFYLSGAAKLTLTDCGTTPGKITGFRASAIMCDGNCNGAAIHIYNIAITGNSNTSSGGAVVLQGSTNGSLTNVTLSNNTSIAHAGALFISGTSEMTLTDCVLKDNAAGTDGTSNGNGGAVNVQPNSALILKNSTITGNTTNSLGGAIYRHVNARKVQLTGDVQITGNTKNGEENNLYLAGTSQFTVENLGENASIGISTGAYDRVVSNQLTADCSGHFSSDNTSYEVLWRDNALYLGVGHRHCVEGDSACTDHSLEDYVAWNNATKLPDATGKYYLTTDVTVTSRARLESTDVTLCLNGHTIRAAEDYAKSRAFYLSGAAKLTLTDCGATPGKITGFRASAVMCDQNCNGAAINIYNIAITGNSNTDTCAGICLQGTATLNLYSGMVSDNTSAKHAGGIFACGKTTVNLLGGQITGNTAANNGGGLFVEGENAVINLSGTTVSGNTASQGGGIYCQNGARLNMTGGAVSGNHAAENAGGVMINLNSGITMTSGAITGNTSDSYTAGLSLQNGATAQLSGDAKITDNAAKGTIGGVYVHSLVKRVQISDNVRIIDNTADGQPHNLYLAGTATFEAGKLGQTGNVGISTGTYFRNVSAQTEEDVSAGYYSDNRAMAVVYQDKALYIGAPDGHSHCLCAGENQYCKHDQEKFAAWDKTDTLPASGNWYLTEDVLIRERVRLDTGSVKLCLNGHTIRVAEGTKRGRVFYLYGDAKLTITDCAEKPGLITGANETAIMFDGTCAGAQYNMYNITMAGNSTTMAGGAVHIQGKGTFNMYSGTLSDNTFAAVLATDEEGKPLLDAAGNQSVKHATGGGAIASNSVHATINIYGGKIINNKALRCGYQKADGTTAYAGGSGGAIYAKGDVTIYDGQITGNTAESNGGGIQVGGNNTTLIIHGGKISGNTAANAAGGLISQNLTTVILNGGEISGNSAKTAGGVYVSIRSQLTMNGGQISGNTATAEGGGMFVYASTVTLNGGVIKNNKATSNGGGICSAKGTATVNGEKVNLGPVITVNKDFAITGNYTEKNGGGIMLNGKDGLLTLDGGSVSNNTAKEAAGGVLIQNSSSFVMKSGKVSGNTAKTGGGIYVSTNTKLKMSGGSVSGNSTTTSNGAGIQMLRSEGTFTGGSVSGNRSGSSGGGIYLSGATAYLYGTYIGGNTAVKNGGGVGTGQTTAKVNGVTTKFQCKLVLDGSTVEKNEAVNGGGVLLQSYTVFDIRSGAIRDNKASAAAGGVYASTNATVNMTGGSVTGNHATKNGGGLYHMNSVGNYTGGQISGNTTKANGAAFLGSGKKTVITVKGYEFTGCNGNNGAVATIQSGATILMEDCVLRDNQSASGSGTVYVSTNSFGTFANCKFENNRVAKQGAAFYGAQNCKVTMTDCRFTGNTAGTDGGAILCRGNMKLTNCTVSGNTAGGGGGGIATGRCGIRGSKFQEGLVLENTSVTDNISGGLGGGLYLSTGCRTTMTDVTITGNKATLEGGAFWAVDDTTLHNVTATGNISGGQGYAAWYHYSIFDGHSYFVGVHKISGDMIIKDNEGGNVYMDVDTAISVGYEGLGQKTEMGVTLDSGVLTNRIFGEYHYEGGDLNYLVTYGDRSFREPERSEAPTTETEPSQPQTQQTEPAEGQPSEDNTLLYAGIGGIAAVILLAAVAVVLVKKKKAGKAESK